MSFLQLSPAAKRLRQVAKAHAAGEIQRSDYRRVRREIIEELHVDFADRNGNAGSFVDSFSLQPDDTLRRPPPEAGREPEAQPQAMTKNETRRSGYYVAWVVLLLFVMGWSAFASAAVVRIPPVLDRDPNPLNSMVLPIQRVKIADLPVVRGVDESEVEELLRQWYDAAVAKAGELQSSGFSEAELAEVGGLLRRLGVHDEEGLDNSAVAALNALVRRQRSRRGLSLLQLEQIASRLESYYREKGYLVARAFVPAQTIDSGYAVLEVLPGRLSSVDVETDSRLGALASKAFDSQLGGYAQLSSLEQRLYQLNDLPGVRATGSLRAGENVGDTALNLTLDSPQKLVPSVAFDNYGDERSARYRLRGAVDWQNPLGVGDLLSLSAAQKFEPEGANSVSLAYHAPGWLLGDTLHGAFSLNDFTINPRGDLPNINGRATTFEFTGRRLLIGARARSWTVGVGGAVQKLELADVSQRLWWLAPELKWHRVLDRSRWVLRGSTNLVGGKISRDSFTGQPTSFIRSHSVVSAWRPIGEQTLRLDAAVQIGSQDLPDSQKIRMGGVGRLSGLRPSSFVADSALIAGVEMSVTPRAWRRYGSLEVFTRLGQGTRTLSDDRESAFAWDGGVMWRVPELGPFSGRLRLSVPFVVNGMEDSHDSARLLFDFAWRP